MRYQVQIAALVLIGSSLCSAGVAKAARKGAQKPSAAAPPIATPPVQQVVPPRPLTREEMPTTPPNVGLSNGLLTIAAENSTLGDVLNAVRHATGAAIDVPPSAATERVVVQLGPGEPREVLQKLLSGSKFDYIIVGSPQNAAGVQRIILTARSGGPAGPGGNNQPNAVASAGAPRAYQPPPEDEYQPPDDVNADMDPDEPGRPEASPEIPDVNAPGPPQPGVPGQQLGQPGQQTNQNPTGPRTPEQLLQELQRLQQQQQGNQPQPK